MSDEEMYQHLSAEAFGTSDIDEIQQKFAQNQRRGFRLSIANLIEDAHKLKPYKDQLDMDAKVAAGTMLGQTFDGDVQVEMLPVGFVFTLGNADFAKVVKDPLIGGRTIHDNSVPDELKGRVLLLNKDVLKTEPELQTMRDHEVLHTLFSSFIAEEEGTEVRHSPDDEDFVSLRSPQDHKEYVKKLQKDFLNHATDEIIAYLTEGTEYRSLSYIGGEGWIDHLAWARDNLWKQADMLPEQKVQIYRMYEDGFANYLGQIREFQGVAHMLYKKADNPSTDLTEEKAQALLQLTSVDHIKRLGRYLDLDPSQLSEAVHQEQLKSVVEFSSIVDELVDGPQAPEKIEGERWHFRLPTEKMNEIRFSYPQEALPALLKAISGSHNHFIVGHSIEALESMLHMHYRDMPSEDLLAIKHSLQDIAAAKQNVRFDRGRIGC